MATKRKQQTVQFLFEASSENDITRCVISTSSDTFENNDEEKNGFKELLSGKNGSNQNKVSGNCQQDDYQVKKEGYAEHETIYVDNSRETILNKLGCEVEDNDWTEGDNDSAVIIKAMKESEDIGDGIFENKTENEHVDTTNENDGLGNLCLIKNRSKPQDSEVQRKRGTVSNTCYNRYNDFHNTIRQCTLANLPDNDSQEQFPAASDSNHFEAMHDSTKFPSLVDDKDCEIRCKINDDVIARKHDDNESKYLHLIDYDLPEHVSVIKNTETGHRESYTSKSNSNKRSETLFEVDNNFNIAAQESHSNYVHDYERERQLPDPSNPQRLHEKQTKHYSSVASNNNPTDTEICHQFDSDYNNGMQTGSKVKSLILNYELQVHENDSRHKFEEKCVKQSSDTSTTTRSKNITLTPNETGTHLRTEQSYASYNSPFNKKKQPQVYNKAYPRLHKTESRSNDFINITNSTSNSIDNLSRVPHSERGKQPEIIDATHQQSLQSLESEPSVVYANDENNAEYRLNLKTKESFKNNLPGYNPIEQSMNPGNLNDFKPKYEEIYLDAGDIHRKSSALVPGSKNQCQNSTIHSQVTRAHWYDIQNPLQQPSRKILPVSSEGNTFTSKVNKNKRRNSGISRMRDKRWKSLGELDKMEQLEEYKLPEKISKTTASLENQENMSPKNNNLDTIYFDATLANGAPYYTQRIRSDFNNNAFETLSPDSKPKQCSLLARRKHERIVSGSTKTEELSSKFENKSLKILSPGTTMEKQSPLLARKQGRLIRYLQQEDDNPECLSFQETTRGYDDNLSSSLTALETLDQSPMKRSQKMKDLVNIEYYDINSDEELISKIKRRPRTRSLSEENNVTGYLVPRRQFKSSGDLRSVGLTKDEVKFQSTSKRASSVDLVSYILSQEEQTHGKYAELYGTALHSSSQEFDKPNSGMKVPFQEKSLNAYDKELKHSRVPTYTTAYGTLSKNKKNPYLTEQRYERTPFLASSSQKELHNDHHVPIGNAKNFKSNVKRLTNPRRISIAKANTIATQEEKDIEDISIKCSRYPIKDFQAKQGIYNIEKAEEEWKRRYGKLGYNKAQLHHATDKEFGKLFTHVERESTIRSSSNQSGLITKEVESKTSSSSLFSSNGNKSRDEKGCTSKSESKEFATTLNQLSSYVIYGYKSELGQTYPLLNQDKPEVSVKKRRYYLDDEGDLAHILGDSDEFPKLSMLVHALIRLREVYRIGECTKPLKEEHAINSGNAQLRDAIQNKPMNALKDLIARNKGVDVNVRSQSGSSALHRAAIEGDVGAIRVLIEHGADVNTRDRYGFQPVHSALRHHHYKAAMFLMDCGTDLMSYTSKRIQQFVSVKAIAKQYLRQTLKTPL